MQAHAAKWGIFLIPWLALTDPFPAVSQALAENEGAAGLLAAGADLSPQRLLAAYRQGIFPWFSEGQPILWWSTDPRMVLYTDHFAVSASLYKKLKKIDRSIKSDRRWQIRFDSAFTQVVRSCAGPRREGGGTWISEEIIEGYSALHQQGHAHSAELWHDEKLVAGAYGVCIGRMFYGESMFTHISDGSKIALAYLVGFLKKKGVSMIDCQQETSHLASLGAIPIPREKFIAHLCQAILQPPIESWEPVSPLCALTNAQEQH